MDINKIYLGDCYKLIKEIPDKSIDLIYTDPPYDIGDGGCTGLFKNRNHKKGGLYMTEIMEGNFGKGFNMSILNEFVRVMKYIYIYIWCNKEQVMDYLDFFVKKHNCNWDIIVWSKPTFPPFTCGHFCKDKELCLVFWEKGKIKITGSWEQMRTVVNYPINMADKEDYKHPTIKPIEEVKKRIAVATDKNSIILDPFIGSGTTAVACKELGRNYIGFEINEKYYKIAVDRLNGINQKGQMSLFDTNFKQLDLFTEGD